MTAFKIVHVEITVIRAINSRSFLKLWYYIHRVNAHQTRCARSLKNGHNGGNCSKLSSKYWTYSNKHKRLILKNNKEA